MKYSETAQKLISQLPKFNKAAFEEYITSQILLIGSTNIMQYIDEQHRWNVPPRLRSILLKCDYSHQAKALIKHMDNFDSESCKIWFSNALQIVDSNILMYLEQQR